MVRQISSTKSEALTATVCVRHPPSRIVCAVMEMHTAFCIIVFLQAISKKGSKGLFLIRVMQFVCGSVDAVFLIISCVQHDLRERDIDPVAVKHQLDLTV